MADTLEHWQSEFWQIQRMHYGQIQLQFEITPDYGVLMIYGTMTVGMFPNGADKTVMLKPGVNLWKRYKQAVEILQSVYGADLYKYQSEPK